jgi:large subunit ribosomal protein L17
VFYRFFSKKQTNKIMRHNKKFNHLSRKANHRAAMLSNMACSLIMHKRISTTLAKAKALRIYVEPILTRAKEDNMNNRRLAFSLLKQKEVVTELFQNVGEKIANRPGGYTRILRTGFRLGDAAEMCIIELVDYNENMLKETKKAAKKATRRAGKKAVKEEVAEAVAEAEAPAAEEKAAE